MISAVDSTNNSSTASFELAENEIAEMSVLGDHNEELEALPNCSS